MRCVVKVESARVPPVWETAVMMLQIIAGSDQVVLGIVQGRQGECLREMLCGHDKSRRTLSRRRYITKDNIQK